MGQNCERCGGPTEGQNTLGDSHRHFPDCIAFLKRCLSELQPRAAFGDQCYQDRCENAYVEQSIVNAALCERDVLRRQVQDLEQGLEMHATGRVNEQKEVAELRAELNLLIPDSPLNDLEKARLYLNRAIAGMGQPDAAPKMPKDGRARSGKARMSKLTPEQRHELAKSGAMARWGKNKNGA